jgi:hypothetical protein
MLLMLYAACGLVLSLIVQVVSFTSVELTNNTMFGALFFGMFPSFLSVIPIGRSEKQRKMPHAADKDVDYWGLVLEGCPASIRYVFWACFFYAWAAGMVLAFVDGRNHGNLVWRGASAFEIAFYALGFAVALGAYLRRRAFGKNNSLTASPRS